MMQRTQLVVATGACALTLIAGVGIASATPDISPIVNSTCTYPQVIAALNAQSPQLGAQLEQTPPAVAWLQTLIASGPAERTEMIEEGQDMPGVAVYTPLILTVARTCANF